MARSLPPPDCVLLVTLRSAWTSRPELTRMLSVRCRKKAVVEHAFSSHGIEAVVHAEAFHKPDISRCPKAAFISANVTGRLNLLEAAAAARDRFIFTSTTSLMISQDIRQETGSAAGWVDESFGPSHLGTSTG